MSESEPSDGVLSEGVALVVSAIVGFAVAIASVWYVTTAADTFYESLVRIQPTLEGGGVGTDWVAGNTNPALDFLIALIHAADVIMGLFILFMVFLHWGAFRRLASQMQPAEGETAAGESVAADGGRAETGGEES